MQTLLVIGTLAYAVTTFGYLAVLFRARQTDSRGPYWCFVGASLLGHCIPIRGPQSTTLCRTSTLADLERMEFGSHLHLPETKISDFSYGQLHRSPVDRSLHIRTPGINGRGRLVDGVMGDLVRFSHVGLAILGLTIFSSPPPYPFSIWSSSID